MMGRFLRIGGVWVRHVNNSCNFDPRTRLGVKCKEQLAEPRKKEPFLKQQSFERQMWNLGKTNSAKPWWKFDETLAEPWQDLGGTLLEPSRNLGRTFRRTSWQPNMDLPQRTMESPKAILPRNLYYGWSYCCWGTKTSPTNIVPTTKVRET